MLEFQEAYRKTKLKLELLERREKLESESTLLNVEIKRLRIIAHNEQADVENLETPGIKGLLLTISGKKQAYMEKEQAESRTAQENYEFAVARQESTLHKLSQCNEELCLLAACEEDLRQHLNYPKDTVLTTLTYCTTELPRLQESLSTTKEKLAKVTKLGAFRNGTQSTSALAGTDDKLMAAERLAQETLCQFKIDLENFKSDMAPFGINIDTEALQRIEADYLTDLYTYAIITTRVEKVTVILKRIGFQLDAAKPKLESQKAEQQKNYLRSLLNAGTLK